MKVTTELKNLIRRSFDENRAKVLREAEESAEQEYIKILNEVGKSKEFKAYTKAANTFYEKFKELQCGAYGDNCKPYYTGSSFDNIKEVTPEHFIQKNVRTYVKYNNDVMNSVHEKVKELDLAQESLMIKLTYEKDIETVRSMLAEYDIVI